ncbi:SpoIIE family protein phosphatase [Nocardioides sp. ChNu-153]|uniref:PP2C family protein-serine/threonine phosphatase n=1 Tax=unclassified Nocardioides TaxID=2615069 RepID=UPI0024056E85|nr:MULTISPECIES: SpoIIE family protein phosphatase [unclassified Nocardioides]MDF9717856.1 SpoIIE family protein phosphatase [Nocardioides sp. ChNu-99]MDN7121436.1 SpoIIE family protein phosphatase [Nocardioides sp. ChNu-153]
MTAGSEAPPGLLTAGSDLDGVDRAGLAGRRAAFLEQLAEVTASVHHPGRAVELVADTLVRHVTEFAQVTLHTHQGWTAAGRVEGHAPVDHDGYPIGRQQAVVLRGLLARRSPEHWVLPPDTPDRVEVLARLLGRTPLVAQLEQLDAVGLLNVPLVARGRAIGLLTLARRGPHDFGPDDVTFLEGVAHRVAATLDVCVVVADNRHVAATLRTSLLPPPIPATSGLDLASYSRVAQEEVTVGGDFIDVHGPDDDTTLLLGDAVGKGVVAAVAAKRIRSAVRTAALVDRAPDRILGLTNQVLVADAESAIESFATAVCGRLRRRPDGAVDLDLTNAGHPPPIVLRRDGRLEYVESNGPALGVFEEAAYTSARVVLQPGDTLVCYTDGITEARGAEDMFGEDGIAAALAGLGGAPSSAIVERLAVSVSAFVDGDAHDRDDVAVVAVQPRVR